MNDIKIAVVGLGYVGLPLVLALGKKYANVTGFDMNERKIAALKCGEDPTNEGCEEAIRSSNITISSDLSTLKNSNFFIVCVPTPVDKNRHPDLSLVRKASETVGSVLKIGDIVVYESTVYPGVTEEICGPILASTSGLTQGKDFKLGYSPERITPGDKLRTLEKLLKIVSAEDSETLNTVAEVYESIIEPGVYRAPTIKVAEAAKVIENTQRDLNIALMNELSVIFDRLEINTREVLKAAGTKWNFLPFVPGLVGGHCIGVDPYYLTSKAVEVGYHPEVILAGRRINDSMGKFIAEKAIKLIISQGIDLRKAKITILGLTFKENVSDLRNSKVVDIVEELKNFGVTVEVVDPMIVPEEAVHEYGISTIAIETISPSDCFIFTVPHDCLIKDVQENVLKYVKENGVCIDVKGVIPHVKKDFPKLAYWAL
jgi:UDP-N-acetyl-D-glucosamine/UDP-N-acetyl-D-galactosamine dehydrogenase